MAADPLSSDAHACWPRFALMPGWPISKPADYLSFEGEDALARHDAEAAPIWRRPGSTLPRAFLRTGASKQSLHPEAIRQACCQRLERAVRVDPSNPAYRAALALIYQLSGDAAAYRLAARAALDLDRGTPHADKKLPSAVREKLEAAEQR